jgi:hypothetical protein
VYTDVGFHPGPGNSVVVVTSDDNGRVFARLSRDLGATWGVNHDAGATLSITTFGFGALSVGFVNGDVGISLLPSTPSTTLYFAMLTIGSDTVTAQEIVVAGVDPDISALAFFPTLSFAGIPLRGMVAGNFDESVSGNTRPFGFGYTVSASGIAFTQLGDLTDGVNAGNFIGLLTVTGSVDGRSFATYVQSDGADSRYYAVRYDPSTDSVTPPALLDGVHPSGAVFADQGTVFVPEITGTAFFYYVLEEGVPPAVTFTVCVARWDASSATPGTAVALDTAVKDVGPEGFAIDGGTPDASGRLLLRVFESTVETAGVDGVPSVLVWDGVSTAPVARARVIAPLPVRGLLVGNFWRVNYLRARGTGALIGSGTHMVFQAEHDASDFDRPFLFFVN